MRQYSDTGIIIKRHNLGEYDRLITLYTQNHGKITLKAKGLRRPNSRRSGTLELFNLVKISVVSGKTELDILTETQLVNPFSAWRKHLGRVTLAYQLCEIVDKLVPDHQPSVEIFNLLVHGLSQISVLKSSWHDEIDIWTLQILQALGYWPRNQGFTGDINQLVESVTQKSLNSPRLLKKLRT